MKQQEIAENIGKMVIINGGRDLGMITEMRRLIGKEVRLVKQCKSGLLQVFYENKFYSLAAYNLDVIVETTSNVVDASARFKKREEDAVEELMRNPVIHGINNFVFVVKGNGQRVEIYHKKNADDPFEKWELKGKESLSHLTYLILLSASVLEQKIYMLRDKYEPDTINMELPISFGLPTGVDPEGKPTGYMEQYENDPPKGN